VKLSELATAVGAVYEGGDDPDITGVAPLDRAGPAELAFVARARYLTDAADTAAGALLVTQAMASELGPEAPPYVAVPDVYAALVRLLARLYPAAPHEPGIHPTAVLGRGVRLGSHVSIGPYVVIGADAVIGDRARIHAHTVLGDGCELAEDVILHPQVVLYAGVRVGARSILHAGVKAGVDGFGYAFVDGEHRKIPQVGRCVIGPDVEIGANSTIDRGSVGWTEIGAGVKIDNLAHLGHNVRVGPGTVIVAQAGIGGSTTIGRGVTIAGQAGLPGHTQVGDGATIAAQAGLFGDVPAGQVYSGYPARPHREALRSQAAVARLPDLLKRVRALERALADRGTVTDE